MYPHWWVIPNQPIFLRRTNFIDENIFYKIQLFFSNIGPLYNPWWQCPSKRLSPEEFSLKKSFFLKNVILLSFLCTPFDKLWQTIQYSFFLENLLLWQKKTWKIGFNFQYQSSVPPLINMSFKYVAWRNTFFKKTVFLICEIFYWSLHCVPLLMNHTKTIKPFLRETNFNEENFFSEL